MCVGGWVGALGGMREEEKGGTHCTVCCCTQVICFVCLVWVFFF